MLLLLKKTESVHSLVPNKNQYIIYFLVIFMWCNCLITSGYAVRDVYMPTPELRMGNGLTA